MKEQSAKYPISKRLSAWLFVLVLLTAGACTRNDLSDLDNNAADANARLDGTWKVIAYENLINNTRTVKDSTNSWGGLDVVLTFAEGRITGKKTTNELFGTFSYAGPGKVTIYELSTTEVNEPLWGRLFGEAMSSFKEFTINDNTLTFFYNNGQNAVILEKQ